jgi:hypothetical protein
MDENTVREHAQAHGDAVVSGDLGRAASDLAGEAKGQAGDVMRKLPRPVTAAEVESVTSEGDETVALIRYSGEGTATLVESRWAEQEGEPKIVSLSVV